MELYGLWREFLINYKMDGFSFGVNLVIDVITELNIFVFYYISGNGKEFSAEFLHCV